MSYKVLSSLINVIIVIITFFVTLKLSYIGFPDGHITAYEQASSYLGKIFIVLNVCYFFYFIYIGFSGKNKKKAFAFIVSVFTYCVLIGFYISAEYYFYYNLDHGAGG